MIGDILRRLRKDSGMTIAESARRFGVAPRTYSSYEAGEREPNITMIIRIADFYGVTTDYLLGRETPPMDLKRKRYKTEIMQVNEDAFAEIYEQVPDEFKQIFFDVMLKLSRAAAEKKRPAEVLLMLPYYDAIPVAFVTGLYDDSNNDPEERAFVRDAVTGHADYCCRVSGDSMEPLFYSGDIVAVRQQEEVETGEIGVFAISGEMFVKKLGPDCLISLNPKYDAIPLTPDVICQGRVLGKAVMKA